MTDPDRPEERGGPDRLPIARHLPSGDGTRRRTLLKTLGVGVGVATAGCSTVQSLAEDVESRVRAGSGGDAREPRNGWQLAMDGTPDDRFQINELATDGSVVYTVFERDDETDAEIAQGLYRYDPSGSQVWEQVLGKPSGYAAGSVFVDRQTETIVVVTKRHGVYTVETDENGEYSYREITRDDTPESGVVPHTAVGGGALYLTAEREDGPDPVWRYDLQADSWSNLGSPPGETTNPIYDGAGRVWTATDAGIFFYENGSWETAYRVESEDDPLAGFSVGAAANGTVYAAGEIEPTTQQTHIYRYTGAGDTGEDNWSLQFSVDGYTRQFVPIGEGSIAVAYSGRFGMEIVGHEKLWTVPSFASGLSVSDGSTQLRSSGCAVTDDGTIYYAQRFDDYHADEPKRPRIMAYSPNIFELPFYTNNVDLDTGTHLTGGDPEPRTVDLLPDGRIAVGLESTARNDVRALGNGSPDDTGRILLLNGDGTRVEYGFVVGTRVLDTDVDPTTGHLVVATDSQVLRIDPDTRTVAWSIDSAADWKAVSIDAQGRIAVALEKTVRVFDATGSERAATSFDVDYLQDVDLNGDDDLLYVVGFNNQTLPGGNPVQGPFLEAYDLQFDPVWDRFGFPGDRKANNVADSRLNRVEYVDGDVFVLGESAGSQSVFRYDGQRLDGESALSVIDHYNHLWDTASAHITYHAHFDATTGEFGAGQFSMTRLSSGKSNTFDPNAIAADSSGRVFVGGQANYAIPARAAQRIDDQPVDEYAATDPSLLGLTSDFTQRLAWTTFNRDGGIGSVRAVDTDGDTVVALASITDGGEAFTTDDAIIGTNDGRNAAYLAVIDPEDNFTIDNSREREAATETPTTETSSSPSETTTDEIGR